MTRGTMCLFTSDNVYAAVEFNGDQYFDGLGQLSARLIQNVKNIEDLEKAAKYLDAYYCYEEEDWVYSKTGRYTYEELLDTGHEYVRKYFSDYLFVINRSGSDLQFNTGDGKRILPDEESGVLHFGGIANDFPPYLDAFKRAPNIYKADEKDAFPPDILTEEEKEEISKRTNGGAAFEAWGNWAVFARREAVKVGACRTPFEKYFDVDRFMEDYKIKDTPGLMELTTGKIARLF